MDYIDTGSYLPNSRRLAGLFAKTDYKEKLKRDPSSIHPEEAETVAALQDNPPYANQVRALARHADAESVAFQCVAASALQTLEQVLYRERRSAEAALSLGQQNKMQAMAETTAATVEALRATLTQQGRTMLRSKPDHTSTNAPEDMWWFALSEALAALEEGATWVRSIAAGQPRGSATHTLSQVVARLLHTHHQEVFAEAEDWIN